MDRCDAHEYFEELSILARKFVYEEGLDKGELARLRELLKLWNSTECPNDARDCVPGRCPYANPLDWVTYKKHEDLFSLLNNLEVTGMTITIKKRKSLDAMNATWARRPGHYNP